KDLVPGACATSRPNRSGPRAALAVPVQGDRLVLQGLAFPAPVPIFAPRRPNQEDEANLAREALLGDKLKVTDVLLGDEPFGGGLFPDLYEEAGGGVLTPRQLPQERRSWKEDLDDDRKETLELLFQRILQALGLKGVRLKEKVEMGRL